MANHALTVLEDALRARKLDRTLTTAIPPGKGGVAPTALAGLDAGLYGGLPRGQLSDMAGPRSSGRTTLLLQMLAAATRRGEIAALVDTFDRLDLASVVAAGVDLDRLLWIRGHAISRLQGSGLGPQSGPWALGPEALVDRTIERALKALNLVLQAGGFGVVALDLADASPAALRRIPFTTWLRVQRTIEGSDTACVLVAPQPLARSAGGFTLALAGRTQWAGQPTRPQASGLRAQAEAGGSGSGAASSRSHRLAGLDVTVRVVSPRRRVDGEVMVAATASR